MIVTVGMGRTQVIYFQNSGFREGVVWVRGRVVGRSTAVLVSYVFLRVFVEETAKGFPVITSPSMGLRCMFSYIHFS